jgi:hypothetical protein
MSQQKIQISQRKYLNFATSSRRLRKEMNCGGFLRWNSFAFMDFMTAIDTSIFCVQAIMTKRDFASTTSIPLWC